MAAGEAIRGQVAPVTAQFSQTAFIFAVLGFAFLFYITIRGDLPKWLGVFGFATKSPVSTTGLPAAGTNTAGGALPDVLSGNYGNTVVPFPTLPTPPTIGMNTGQ